MGDTYFLIFGIVVALIGLLIFVICVLRRVHCSKTVDAEITTVHTETSRIRGSTVYHYRPVITYTVDGTPYPQNAPFRSYKSDKYVPGKTLRVSYNPNHPESFCFRRRIGGFLWALALLAVGVLFIVLYFI